MISLPAMNLGRLEMGLLRAGKIIDGRPGYWRFLYREREMLCVADPYHNRMRIMAPVADESELSHSDLHAALSANFGRALDARYALSDGILWSIFLHPLGGLREGQLLDAISQVEQLAENFGTTYASADIVYGE